MTLLVTGANGFVGSTLCARFSKQATPFRAATRRMGPELLNPDAITVETISGQTDWTAALRGVKQVVHLAARVHVMREISNDPLAEFLRVNLDGTANLAEQAARGGVRRLVFVSSVKVNGEATTTGHAFTADDKPAPQDPYGVSKNEAEQALRRIASETGMDIVIIRPPLVYGPGVKGNFAVMMRWLARGLPLPLAAVTNNRRSFVAVENLVDLIVTCISHPRAANNTFMVSDGEDLSTAELLRRMGLAIGKRPHLFHIPNGLLELAAKAMNRGDLYQRLCGSLQVDIEKTRQVLGWRPPISIAEGLQRAVGQFRA